MLLSIAAVVAAVVLLVALALLGVTRLVGADQAPTQTVSGDDSSSTGGSQTDPSSGGTGGSSPSDPDAATGQGGPGNVPIDVAVTITPSRLTPGQVVTLTLSVRNRSGEAVTVDYKTSLEADFTVQSGDRVVWQWSRSRQVTLADRQVVIDAVQTMSFQAAWDGRDDSGRNLPIGDYTVRGVYLGQLAGRALPIVSAPAAVVVTP